MLVPESRNIASIPLSTMRLCAFSMRPSRSSSDIGVKLPGYGCRFLIASGTSDCGAQAVAPPSVAAPAVPAATFKKFLLLVRIVFIAPFVGPYGDLAPTYSFNNRVAPGLSRLTGTYCL